MSKKEDRGVIGEYEVSRFLVGKPIRQVVRVSFELDARGWSQLQRSKKWYRLLEVLGDLQRE